jgi:2-oxoglutarate ferredoxin oxidoreductase subunit alpha
LTKQSTEEASQKSTENVKRDKPIKGKQKAFMTGNEVVAWAALAAEADIMFGYPITPSTDIMHYWTRLAPKFGRKFLQTEDEISAGFTTCGGALAGARAFTATAGPGNILMQESLVMAEMMRIPMVFIVMQRGGPSTATVIYSQQEVTMSAYGGNGEGFRVVYSTCDHQELFDYTIKSFNVAWTYKFPTIVLGDGYQAKMRESLTLYDPAEKGIKMVPTTPALGAPGFPSIDRQPAQLRNTYNTEEELYEYVMCEAKEYQAMADKLAEFEEEDTGDCEVLLLVHGIVTRAAREAVKILRKQGIKAGFFRPITLRPFPKNQLQKAVKGVKNIIVAESALGQFKKIIADEIPHTVNPLHEYYRPGIGITSDELVDYVKGVTKNG